MLAIAALKPSNGVIAISQAGVDFGNPAGADVALLLLKTKQAIGELVPRLRCLSRRGIGCGKIKALLKSFTLKIRYGVAEFALRS